MKLEIKDFCIRCGMCEDLYPEIFKENYEKDCIDVLYDEIPVQYEEMARSAIRDCAIAAIHIKK